MHSQRNEFIDRFSPFFFLIGFILFWQLIDYIFAIEEIILPSPLEIFYTLQTDTEYLFYHLGITLIESFFGFVVGSVLAISIAIMFVRYPIIRKSSYPYAVALKATPLYAFAPLLVLWFGNGMLSKIVMSSLVAFFPVLVGSVKGLTAVDTNCLDLLSSYQASTWQILQKLRFPNALPYIFPALKISTTLAVVGATIAEFTGANRGIGHLIVISSYYLETSTMFSSIILVSVLGVFFFQAVEFVEKKIVFWQEHG